MYAYKIFVPFHRTSMNCLKQYYVWRVTDHVKTLSQQKSFNSCMSGTVTLGLYGRQCIRSNLMCCSNSLGYICQNHTQAVQFQLLSGKNRLPHTSAKLPQYRQYSSGSDNSMMHGDCIYTAPDRFISWAKFFRQEAPKYALAGVFTSIFLMVLSMPVQVVCAAGVVPCLVTGVGQFWASAIALTVYHNRATDTLSLFTAGKDDKSELHWAIPLADLSAKYTGIYGPMVYIKLYGKRGQRIQLLLDGSAFKNRVLRKKFLSDVWLLKRFITRQRAKLWYVRDFKLKNCQMILNAFKDADQPKPIMAAHGPMVAPGVQKDMKRRIARLQRAADEIIDLIAEVQMD